METIIDYLTFRNYCHNRLLSPNIPAEKWIKIYKDQPAFEKLFQKNYKKQLTRKNNLPVS
jgi:hypothetical protein